MNEITLNDMQIESFKKFLTMHEDDIALDFMQGYRDFGLLKEIF